MYSAMMSSSRECWFVARHRGAAILRARFCAFIKCARLGQKQCHPTTPAAGAPEGRGHPASTMPHLRVDCSDLWRL